MKKMVEMNDIPRLYETDDGSEIGEKMIYAHFFSPLNNFDWFVFEYEPETKTCFGFANLNNPDFAELGYFTLDEFEEINKSYGFDMIVKDLHFKTGKVSEIAKTYPVLNKLL